MEKDVSAALKPEKKDGVSFCAEHTHGNALILHAQAKKTSPGLVGEAFFCQLSSHAGQSWVLDPKM